MASIKKVFIVRESSGMSYEDAMEMDDISPEDARREIARHKLDWSEFVKDVGQKPKYTGAEILGWLGY